MALDKRRFKGEKEGILGTINLQVDGRRLAYKGIIPSDPRVLEKEKARPSPRKKVGRA